MGRLVPAGSGLATYAELARFKARDTEELDHQAVSDGITDAFAEAMAKSESGERGDLLE